MWPVLETDIGPCSVLRGFANRLARPPFPVPLTDLGEQEAVTTAKAEHEINHKGASKVHRSPCLLFLTCVLFSLHACLQPSESSTREE